VDSRILHLEEGITVGVAQNELGRSLAFKLFVSTLLFIIRVKRELKRVYRNGCRYNERLNAETGGFKTPRTHWVARVNI
jgi:hypothetical protein